MTDADTGYAAATTSAAVFPRTAGARLAVRGRAPRQMLNGILTGTLPSPPSAVTEGVLGGRGTYHTVLTAKGKMIADLWCVLLGDEESDGLLLDVPRSAVEGLASHFGRFLPPRMATMEDVSASTSKVTVVGPSAATLLTRLALGLRFEASDLAALPEGEWRALAPSATDGLVVMRTCEVWPMAFDLAGPPGVVDALSGVLATEGVPQGSDEAWTTLRVETGRPAYGVDMDDTTIPVEAGIHERAIDYAKGCYTGQEVIVRIRDRGHVNRTLRLVHLGDVDPPARGAELFQVGAPTEAKAVATVTSAVRSPRYGETVALAYVRRGVDGSLEPR